MNTARAFSPRVTPDPEYDMNVKGGLFREGPLKDERVKGEGRGVIMTEVLYMQV
jgi:hypothetical protein